MAQTAKNLDSALARLVAAGGTNLAARFERNTSKIDALKSAEREAIEAASARAAIRIGLDDELADRAIEYTYRESILQQANRERIAEKASEEIRHNPGATDAGNQIDADWLNQFSRLAENTSGEALQSLWAKILAGEIRKPGSFRIRTLQQVSILSSDEAQLIHKILMYAIDREFIFRDDNRSFIAVGDLITCEHLDVLSGAGGTFSLTIHLQPNKPRHFHCHDQAVLVEPSKDLSIKVGAYPLSIFGRDLLNVIGETTSNREYVLEFAKKFKAKEAGRVSIAKIGSFDASLGGCPILEQSEV